LVTSAAQSAVDAVGDAERERPASSSIGKPRQTVDSIGEMLGCPRRQIIPINQSPSPGTDYHLIEEIGIGDKRLTGSREADLAFLKSFS